MGIQIAIELRLITEQPCSAACIDDIDSATDTLPMMFERPGHVYALLQSEAPVTVAERLGA